MCFLEEAYHDTVDHMFDIYTKAINNMYTQADTTIATHDKSKRQSIRYCLLTHKKLCNELLMVGEEITTLAELFKKWLFAKFEASV
jgi:hypothetical protein